MSLFLKLGLPSEIFYLIIVGDYIVDQSFPEICLTFFKACKFSVIFRNERICSQTFIETTEIVVSKIETRVKFVLKKFMIFVFCFTLV